MQPISFLINTSVNTLDHVKLLLRSLKDNLKGKEHEILIFVDSDNEGTVDYLLEQKKYFHDLRIITHKLQPCVGYSRNNNLLVELAKHDIVSYLQSDMVISKDYDVDVLEELEDNCILSATRIEPPLHGLSDVTITHDFGIDPNYFQWESFIEHSQKYKQNKSIEYFFAPFTFYKKVWLDVGGYDTLFRRSREDSDLLQRFIQKGVKIKQTFKANVYHFSCVSSRGKNWFDNTNNQAQTRVQLQNRADQVELGRFIRKWGTFDHGSKKLVRLDIDLHIPNLDSGTKQLLYQIEPFFTKVWLNSESDKKAIIDLHDGNHIYANQLLNFSIVNWEVAKQYYRSVDYNSVYEVGQPVDYNILVTINQQQIEPGDLFLNNLSQLSDLIGHVEPGTYQLGCATLDVRQIVNIAE